MTTADFFEEDQRVRIFMDTTGEPWFVAADVCAALGIDDNRDAVSRLDDDEQNTVAIAEGIHGTSNTTIVSEPGVYRLVFTSRAKTWLGWPGGGVVGRQEVQHHSAAQLRQGLEHLLAAVDGGVTRTQRPGVRRH